MLIRLPGGPGPFLTTAIKSLLYETVQFVLQMVVLPTNKAEIKWA
jgi:hypothetical protein